MPDRNHVKEEGSTVQGIQFITEGNTHQQKHKIAGHLASMVRKQRKVNSEIPLNFFFSLGLRSQSTEW